MERFEVKSSQTTQDQPGSFMRCKVIEGRGSRKRVAKKKRIESRAERCM
jgi:hypothetical protein